MAFSRVTMQISEVLAAGFNRQISHEQGNVHLYEQVACWARIKGLKHVAEMFAKQADEERGHAEKFLSYLEETNALVVIPAVEAKPYGWESCMEVASTYLEAEKQTTMDINQLMDLAMQENDYSAQDFLQPMCREQSEEVTSAERFMASVEQSGGNILLLDIYVGE